MKHLAMAITAALVLPSVGASAAGAAGAAGTHQLDRRIHQHQGIGGPRHHHGKHPR